MQATGSGHPARAAALPSTHASGGADRLLIDLGMNSRAVFSAVAAALSVWAIACGPATGENRATQPTAPTAAAAVPAHPNVVLVTIDTLRADHCGAYGYPRPTTPHLDAVAAAGTLFETAYTPMPTTLPAHAALFTSRHPRELGVRENGVNLPEDATTLAEILRSAGYATAAFVSSFVLDERFGLEQGFDHYDDDFSAAEGDLRDHYRWQGKDMHRPFDRRGRATTDAARAWLQSREGGAPFFLWVHYFDPHQPLRPREPFYSQFARKGLETEPERVVDLYDAEVRYADEQIGRLLAAVRGIAPGGETLTVIAADHGEGLWQHGWLEHGVNLYEEAVRVPFVWHWPGRIAAGQRVAPPVSLIDTLPTILGLLELPAPDTPIRGRDLSAVVSGSDAADPERYVFMKRRHYERQMIAQRRIAGPVVAVRWGAWKLIHSKAERGIELYDLARDPGESVDVAGWRPKVTRLLSSQLASWQEAHPQGPARPATLPEDVRRGLEALGYVE